jgi:hypothetical protein
MSEKMPKRSEIPDLNNSAKDRAQAVIARRGAFAIFVGCILGAVSSNPVLGVAVGVISYLSLNLFSRK